jgi:hemoglobin
MHLAEPCVTARWIIACMAGSSLFEQAGGEAAFLPLAAAHHRRCLEDPELNHPFSHGISPMHVERLAWYWAEALGGPPRFSASGGSQSAMLTLHANNGPMDDLGRRFVACFVGAMDDAGLPDDPGLRASLRAYMEWSVRDVLVYAPYGSEVPDGLPVPRWPQVAT